MKRAFVLIRPGVPERMAAVKDGLARCGYQVRVGEGPRDASPADIIVIWNRYGLRNVHADTVASRGGRVVVMENGYCGSDATGHQLYAMALDGHLGTGRWFARQDDTRWRSLGVALQPWRKTGEHIVVCLSRGIGHPAAAMPKPWAKDVVARLVASTKRRVVVRNHPGDRRSPSTRPLSADLEGAHAAVVWASNAGTEALIAGVPVFHGLPSWIMAPAAKHGTAGLEEPFLGDREPAFVRMSWAQWTLAEIAAGEPFDHLLRREH